VHARIFLRIGARIICALGEKTIFIATPLEIDVTFAFECCVYLYICVYMCVYLHKSMYM
jgi:hypothetical protein